MTGGLLSVSALLAALAFPNPLIERGFPCAMWFACTGVFFVIARLRLALCLPAGAFFGALTVTLQNYWLSFYHPLAGVLAAVVFSFYYAAFFGVLKLAALAVPRGAAFVQSALWVGFEWLRTLGFAGYSYGIAGYSQWTLPPLIRCAALAGVWGVSLVVILPQAAAGNRLAALRKNAAPPGELPRGIRRSLHAALAAPSVFAALGLAALALGYGIFAPRPAPVRSLRVALIQPNSNPWKSDLAEFRRELGALTALSDAALNAEPPPELVVWPETAFVPSFYYHGRYRPDAGSAALVLEAEAYLASKNVPFVLGNDEGRRVPGADGERVASYNAALLFDGGAFVNRYYKMKLVPFAESFPYAAYFPAFSDFLLKHDSHFWDAGSEPVLFETAGVKLAAPICFEDTFGAVTREFVRRGAELIVNLSNDSWAHSGSAQWTHLAVASFRAVETGRTLVRATTSGETCAVNADGSIIALAPPFAAATLNIDAPIYTHTTPYTRAGDWLPAALLACAALAMIAGAFTRGWLRRFV